MEHFGKLSESPELEKITMEGYQIPLNETSSYASKDETLYYTQKHIFNKTE